MVQTRRERGTLESTLPKSPSATLLLFIILCTAVSSYATVCSFRDENQKDLTNTVLRAGIGATITVVGIIYSNPLIYGTLFPTSLFCLLLCSDPTLVEKIDFQSIQHAIPLIMLLILSKSSTFMKLSCSLTGNGFILNQYNLFALCAVPLISMLIALSQMIATGKEDRMIHSPCIIIGVAVLFIYHSYYTNRSHKNGDLTTKRQQGAAAMTALSVLYFVSSSPMSTNYDSRVAIPFLLGSVTTVGFGAIFAFVADCWYTIGTGQFFMVSLDTAGILFYFVLPIVILVMRFFDKYGNHVKEVTHYLSMLLSVPLQETGVSIINETQLHTLLIFFMTLPVVIGIPLLHNLCPITGHLFGRVYTHGNPNTKKAAICVQFSEYQTILNNDKLEAGLLNIFVTLNDLNDSASIIRDLHDRGHNIGLTLTNNETDSSSSLNQAFSLCEKITETKPTWYHTGIDHTGKLPNCYHAALQLKMRSASWSTLIDVSNTQLTANEIKAIEIDLEIHRGGLIFYLTRVKQGNQASMNILLSLSTILKQNGFKSTTLSHIANEDNQMDL